MKNYLLLLCLLITTSAQAGILGSFFSIEPSVGYKSETTKLTDLSGAATTEIKTTAPALGLKLNIHSTIGVDLSVYGEWVSGDANISNLSEKQKFNKYSNGAQLAVNSLGFVKMYLGTTFTNEFKVKSSDTFSETTLGGPSYHVGLTFRFMRAMFLGLQYNLNQYNEITGPTYTNGDNTETYYSKVDTQDYMIYLSTQF